MKLRSWIRDLALGLPISLVILLVMGGFSRWVDCFRDSAHLTLEGNAAFATALAGILVESDILQAAPRRQARLQKSAQ